MTGTNQIAPPDVEAIRDSARRSFESDLKLKAGDKVLIFGGYGTSNVGDDAILSGLLSALPKGVITTVVSMQPSETERIHGVTAIPPIRVPLELIKTNAVIVGGGGMFSGHMGQMSKLLPLMTLAAGLLRKRVGYCGIGVYASTPGWVKRSLRIAVKRAKLITVRDEPSVEVFASLGIKARLVPDMAMMLDYPVPDESFDSVTQLDNTKTTVVLCLTQTDPQIGKRLLDVVPQVIDRMPEVEFRFLPMSQHPVINSHNDLLLAEELQRSASRLQVERQYEHPTNALSVIRDADAAMCMRFHSMVFAEMAGTPMIPVSYAPKTDNWLNERGLESVQIEPEALVRAIRLALRTRSVQQIA